MSTSRAPSQRPARVSGERTSLPWRDRTSLRAALEDGEALAARDRTSLRAAFEHGEVLEGRECTSLRAAFEDGATVDVHYSGVPIMGGDAAANSRRYLRAYTFGVTEEAPGRYAAEPSGELGRGAIGRVYVAADLHLGRQVAIKELLQGATAVTNGSSALHTISRFLREARVTGTLEHPNIVPVYELGRRADGSLYYTMRVVPGRTLAQAIADCHGIEQRLSLVNHFSGLCQAIAYAHSRGVVHRDIKPDNVMIGEFGETVVLDWGMAKLCGDDGAESKEIAAPKIAASDLGLTQEGSICGTPLYMSPEQASGQTGAVDQRSDVWCLGVVLYAILCGRPPFSGKNLDEIVAQVSAGRYTPLRKIDPEIPAELAAVVQRALRVNRLERYPSARELARDVQAYQAGTRVAAYDYSSLELVLRFVNRHRSAVTASALALIVTLALGVVSYRRVLVARDRALSAERRALDNEHAAQKSAEAARHSLGEVWLDRAKQALLEGDSVDAELLSARALEQEERPDARGVLVAAQSALRPILMRTLSSAKGCTRTALAFSAGMFACATGRELTLYGLNDDQPRIRLPLSGDVVALAFAADASALAVALADGALGVRPASFAAESWQWQSCAQKPSALAVAQGGRMVACGGARGEVEIHVAAEARPASDAAWARAKVSSAQLLRIAFGQALSSLVLSKDGSRLALGGELGALAVYDTNSHALTRFSGHTGTVLALGLVEQGRYLASAGADRTLRFWDSASGAPLQSPLVHSDVISTLAWSDDRRFLAFGAKDKAFRVVDLRTGRSSLARAHDDAVELVSVSADGAEFASYSRDAGLKLWSLPSSQRPSELNEHGNVLALGLGTPPEQLISAGLARNGACIWDLQSGTCSARLPVHLDRVRALSVSRDHRQLAFAGSGSQIFIWDLERRIPTQVIEGLHDETRALAFSADGRTLAAAGLDRKLRLYDTASAHLLHESDAAAVIQTLSVAPNTGALWSGDQAGMLTLWDPNTGRAQASFRAHGDWILGSAISPDGTRLATASADRTVGLWDLRTNQHLFTLAGHTGKVLSVDFSPDGALLASAGEDKIVALWDPHAGRALAMLPGHAGIVRAVRFNSQGDALASGSDDGAIRLWRLSDLRKPAPDLAAGITRQFGL